MAFRLRFISHLSKRLQAGSHFVALQLGSGISTGIALAHDTDFHARTLSHFTGLAHNRLQLVDEAVDRCRHVTDLVVAVQLDALGQVTLTRRQVIECSDQQVQFADHSTPQHHSQQQQHAQAHQRQAHADPPAQRFGRFLNRDTCIAGHCHPRCLSGLQARAQGCRAVFGRTGKAVGNQLLAAGDERGETLVQRCKVFLDRCRGHAHAHLADLHAVRADRSLDVIHRRIVFRSVQNLVHRPLAFTLGQQRLDQRVIPVHVAGEVLARRVVINHEQHVGVALGAPGKFRKGWRIVIPHGSRGDGGQQFGHVGSGFSQVFFKRGTQLRLLFFQARRQPDAQALAGTGRQSVEARRHFATRQL